MKLTKGGIKMDIPNIHDSLKNDYRKGILTLEEVAVEYHIAGFTPYVDIEYAKSKMKD